MKDVYTDDVRGDGTIAGGFGDIETHYAPLMTPSYSPEHKFVSFTGDHGPYFIQIRVSYEMLFKMVDKLRKEGS